MQYNTYSHAETYHAEQVRLGKVPAAWHPVLQLQLVCWAFTVELAGQLLHVVPAAAV